MASCFKTCGHNLWREREQDVCLHFYFELIARNISWTWVSSTSYRWWWWASPAWGRPSSPRPWLRGSAGRSSTTTSSTSQPELTWTTPRVRPGFTCCVVELQTKVKRRFVWSSTSLAVCCAVVLSLLDVLERLGPAQYSAPAHKLGEIC